MMSFFLIVNSLLYKFVKAPPVKLISDIPIKNLLLWLNSKKV